jgi:hypothetical protein
MQGGSSIEGVTVMREAEFLLETAGRDVLAVEEPKGAGEESPGVTQIVIEDGANVTNAEGVQIFLNSSGRVKNGKIIGAVIKRE